MAGHRYPSLLFLMVLPVSGFLPVPLPMMIPFMGAQSLVIGKMFGEGFQYGKRKISAMPNAEFNKLTFETMMSNARDEMQASIPTMIQAMQDMKPMVAAVIHEFTNYLSLVIQEAPSQAEQIISDAAHTLAPHEEEQIPSGHTEELNIFETIAEQFPHIHDAGAVDMPKVGVDLPLVQTKSTFGKRDVTGVSAASLEREKQRRAKEMERLAAQQRDIHAKGQAGLKISQKVQRLPLTNTQVTLFENYRDAIAAKNRWFNQLKGYMSAPERKRKNAEYIRARNLAEKYRVRITQARSTNLKGFELYGKWLAQ